MGYWTLPFLFKVGESVIASEEGLIVDDWLLPRCSCVRLTGVCILGAMGKAETLFWWVIYLLAD